MENYAYYGSERVKIGQNHSKGQTKLVVHQSGFAIDAWRGSGDITDSLYAV